MVRDISTDLWLLWCNILTLAVQLTFELEFRQTCYKNEKNGMVIAISVI